MKWYRKAAEQGHARAQYNLGYSLVDDPIEAYAWLDVDLENRQLSVREVTYVGVMQLVRRLQINRKKLKAAQAAAAEYAENYAN